ncbi:MAG: AAA family ATPase [Deltaproteobacteria bacterium]|nr:AAA family ATPase [Deltaproteobacteria bacterium]MBW2396748.1 AAA family ATPase [Deltaproteobacteria bacterium]
MDGAEVVVKALREEIARVLVGQEALVDGLLIGLLSGGHVLVEGVPGLAKTTAVRTLAQVLGLGFRRIQFTPDLLPSDLVGTPIFVPEGQRFEVHKGPVFSPVVLADEINRAPAKVQSALLEAMEERQVTIGDQTFPLPEPFLVMATQNPIDLEGTYALPEAQVDRFLLKLQVHYPSAAEELEIVARDGAGTPEVRAVANPEQILGLRAAAGQVHAADPVIDYAVRLVRATREPDLAGAVLEIPERRPASGAVAVGASPRASIFLCRAARARALLEGRRFVTPHDVKRVARDVLRHRLILSYEAEADGIDVEEVLRALLAAVETP